MSTHILFIIIILVLATPILPFTPLQSISFHRVPPSDTPPSRLHSSPPDPPPKRRRKKNKYASFSNAPADGEADPFEQLVASSSATSSRLGSPRGKAPSSNDGIEKTNVTFPDNRYINPYDPSTYGWIPLGYVSAAHGVHGFVKIQSDTDFGEER